jgi:hypothetical protein
MHHLNFTIYIVNYQEQIGILIIKNKLYLKTLNFFFIFTL